MAQITAFLERADEGQTLAGQPAIAGEAPLDDETATHLREGIGHAAGRAGERQAIGGDVRLEHGAGGIAPAREEQTDKQARAR